MRTFLVALIIVGTFSESTINRIKGQYDITLSAQNLAVQRWKNSCSGTR